MLTLFKLPFSNKIIFEATKHFFSAATAKDLEDAKGLFVKRLLKHSKLSWTDTATNHFSFLMQFGYSVEEIANNPKILIVSSKILQKHLTLLTREYNKLCNNIRQTHDNSAIIGSTNDCAGFITNDKAGFSRSTNDQTELHPRSYSSFTRLSLDAKSSKKLLPPLHSIVNLCTGTMDLDVILNNLNNERSKNVLDSDEIRNKLVVLNNVKENNDGNVDGCVGASNLWDLFEISSEEEMLRLLTSNIRLLRKIKFKTLGDKVKYLVERGATMEDIRKNSHILINKTQEVIKCRVDRLISINDNHPLPVSTLSWTDLHFERYIEKGGQSIVKQRIKTEEAVKEVVKKLEDVRVKNSRILFSKIVYLMEIGYTSDEILNASRLMNHSLSKIQRAIQTISNYHVGTVPLRYYLNYIENKRYLVRRKEMSRQVVWIRKELGIKVLPLALNSRIKEIVVTRESIKAVVDYLATFGIAKSDVARLPVLVCHSVDAVRRTWDGLTPTQQFKIRRKMLRGDVFRALNCLQYYIERNIGFRMSVGLTSDDDLGHATPDDRQPIEFDQDNTDITNLVDSSWVERDREKVNVGRRVVRDFGGAVFEDNWDASDDEDDDDDDYDDDYGEMDIYAKR